MDNLNQTDQEFLVSELSRRLERLTLYGDALDRSELVEWLEELRQTADRMEESHDECYSLDYIEQNYYSIDDFNAVKDECEKLRKELKSPSPYKQKLLDKIERLEGELSDARADLSVYKSRLEKGATHAQLAEHFIFSPEEARAHFRCIRGGAA